MAFLYSAFDFNDIRLCNNVCYLTKNLGTYLWSTCMDVKRYQDLNICKNQSFVLFKYRTKQIFKQIDRKKNVFEQHMFPIFVPINLIKQFSCCGQYLCDICGGVISRNKKNHIWSVTMQNNLAFVLLCATADPCFLHRKFPFQTLSRSIPRLL